MVIRVLSYNTHKSRAFVSRRKTWQELLALLRITKPDLVFLQEFLREAEAEQFLETIADNLWPHHSFGQNATLGNYHYGNAILSKFPFVEIRNTDISNSSLERRGLLYGKVQPAPHLYLHLFCCHLDLTHRGREKQIARISPIISDLVPGNAPMVLAGDFNDWQEKLHDPIRSSFGVEEASAELGGKLVPSSPSFFPLFSLDRVYFRGMKPLFSEFMINTPWHSRSDHLPCIVDFELKI